MHGKYFIKNRFDFHLFQFVLGHNTNDVSMWRDEAISAYKNLTAYLQGTPQPAEVSHETDE